MTHRAWLSTRTWGSIMLALLLFVPMAAEAKVSGCSHYPGLANYIVGCIRSTLDSTANNYFENVYPLFENGILAMLTLGVSIFGVMAAFGMLEKVGRDSFMLMIKVAFISYFVTVSDDIYRFTLLTMDSTAEKIVDLIPSSGKSDITAGSDFSRITCIKHAKEKGSTIDVTVQTIGYTAAATSASGPWLAMDCIIDTAIGIRLPHSTGDDKAINPNLKASDEGVARGLVYLFFSTLQTSAFGIFLAVIGFIYLWGLIHMVIRALLVYLAGYIGIVVLIIFAPLFVPMVMFQATKSYFDKWVKLLISFVLQPIIVLVFVVFTVAAVDLATFSSKYSLMYAIAGEESQKAGFSLNEYLSRARADGKSIIADVPLEYGRVKTDLVKDRIDGLTDPNAPSVVKDLQNSDCVKSLMAADPKLEEICKKSYPLQVFHKSLNWELLAESRTPAVVLTDGAKSKGEQISREVMASLILVAVVVFIMNQLLAVMPNVANDLAGDFGQGPNLAAAFQNLAGKRR